ncbi:MAG: hypothetical protein M3Y59_19890 [Myxococcota bacterium]|nr:hypothetical protein [Myxococcota bacterium]
MSQSQQVSDYGNADVVPKSSADDLARWWGRWVDTYFLFKTEVVVPSDGQFLTVKLVGDAISSLPPSHPARQPLEINLRNGRHCWSDLPSTAQMVINAQAPDRFGFLLLTQEWADANSLGISVANTNDDGGGGKFPKGSGGELRDPPKQTDQGG